MIKIILIILITLSGCAAQPQIKQVKVNDSILVLPASFIVSLNDSIQIEAMYNLPQIFESFLIEGNFIFTNPTKLKVVKPMTINIIYTILNDYESIIQNSIFVDSKNLEFDIYFETSGQIILTAYQIALSFNQNIKGTGILSFNYIPGTSELALFPQFGIGLNDNKLTFASNAGNEILSGLKRIGRFRLTNTVDFILFDPQINWSFDPPINTILTGVNFQNITNQNYFKSMLNTKLLIKFN